MSKVKNSKRSHRIKFYSGLSLVSFVLLIQFQNCSQQKSEMDLTSVTDDFDAHSTSSLSQSGEIIAVGALRFNSTGDLLAIDKIDQAYAGIHKPFSITTGENAPRFKVDSMRVIISSEGRKSLRISSSQLANSYIDLSVRDALTATLFQVVGASPNITAVTNGTLGLALQITLNSGYECQLGYTSFAPGSHSCSSLASTVAAFCLSGNCENLATAQAPTLNITPLTLGSKIGAELIPMAVRPLVGSKFALLFSNHPYRSTAFLKDVHAFKSLYGTTAENGSSLFLNDPPPSSCPSNVTFCEDSARKAARDARSMGFDEVQMADYTWMNLRNQSPNYGMFDAAPTIPQALAAMRAEGVCPVLHGIGSVTNSSGEICQLNPDDSPQTCPAALRDQNGNFVLPPGGVTGMYILDFKKDWVFNSLMRSVTQGALSSGACGMYVDGSDWFGSHRTSAPIYYEEFWKKAPNLRLWGNWAHGNAAMWMTDIGILDRWQINFSESPRTWSLGWGYFAMKGLLESIGMQARLGWVPLPSNTDQSRSAYQPMLNAAVATGSFLTIQADSTDPTLTGASNVWFKPAVKEVNAALREIRSGRALGHYDSGSARHEVIHFTSGVSTVALFDSIVPASLGSKHEGRSFGLQTIRNPNQCGPFQSCFYFTGEKRMPVTYEEPKIPQKGSFIHHPGIRTKKDFTIAAWVKPEEVISYGGIFERGAFGYGMFYDAGKFSAHFSTSNGQGMLNLQENAFTNSTQWHHLTVSYDSATKTIRHYIDGQLKGGPKAMAWSDEFYRDLPIFVGTRGDAYTSFKGWMNDIRFYDRAVSDQEVQGIFARITNVSDPHFMLGWSSETPTPTNVVVDVDLGSQKVVYLVPMLEGDSLPPETIRLTFRDIRNPDTAQIVSQVAISKRVSNLSQRTVTVEINSSSISMAPLRIEVKEK